MQGPDGAAVFKLQNKWRDKRITTKGIFPITELNQVIIYDWVDEKY